MGREARRGGGQVNATKKLWLDDVRPAPEGWVWAKTAAEAISHLVFGNIAEVSLDHDLGPNTSGTGYDVAAWIEREAYLGNMPRMELRIHSANPVGKMRMEMAIENANRYWAERARRA